MPSKLYSNPAKLLRMGVRRLTPMQVDWLERLARKKDTHFMKLIHDEISGEDQAVRSAKFDQIISIINELAVMGFVARIEFIKKNNVPDCFVTMEGQTWMKKNSVKPKLLKSL